MEIIYKKIEELKEYENNPRHNGDAIEYVANSIKEFGFKVPIIVDKDNVIIAGHTRLKASQKLGLKEVPVIVADDLSEEQAKAFRLADNKIAELSLWDFDKLKKELEEIGDMDDFFINGENMNIIDILENEGLNKPKVEEKQKFSVSFSIPLKYEDLFENFKKENGKEELENVFYKVIKGE